MGNKHGVRNTNPFGQFSCHFLCFFYSRPIGLMVAVLADDNWPGQINVL
jgi:hypothetical protein